MAETATMTERQQAWFASVKANLEKETGRSLEDWAALIAKTCPEIKHRARLTWMKEIHGLGQNRASVILDHAFPSAMGWSEPETLADTLWKDPAAKALFEALKAELLMLPEVVVGQRKAFCGFSRKVQFAAARPDKQALILGLAVSPDAYPDLEAPNRASWSERLKSQVRLETIADIAAHRPAIQAAWEAS